MKLPKQKRKLHTIFRNASVPTASEFSGEYSVDMLTGLPSLKAIAHRKIFYRTPTGVEGYNLLLRTTVWGHFYLYDGYDHGDPMQKVAVIQYNRLENSFIVRNMRDYVRCIEKGMLYLGKLNYCIGKTVYFLGYFSLSKKR